VPQLVLRLDGEGADWVGLEGGEARRVNRCGAEHDFAALGEALEQLSRQRGGCRELTLIAQASIPYRTVIAAMDRANAAGLTEQSLSAEERVAWLPPPAGAATRVQAARCAEVVRNEPAPAASDVAHGAPVVLIEPDRVALDDQRWIAVAPGDGEIDALTRALTARRVAWRAAHPEAAWRGTIVVRTSPSARAALVQRVLRSAQAAGYGDVQMAE
jgi:biopolymer transport protein ExbD